MFFISFSRLHNVSLFCVLDIDTLRGIFNPQAINLYQGKKKIVQGGCKGCHGNAQKSDFSFITQNAPIVDVDFINQPLLKEGQ